MMTGSLRVRLLVASSVSILGTLAVAGGALVQLFERHVDRRIEEELDNHLRQILAIIEPDDEGRPSVPRPLADPRFEMPLSGLYWQVVSNGVLAASSPSLSDETLTIPRSASLSKAERVVFDDVEGPRGKRVFLVVRQVTAKFSAAEHQLQLAAALDESDVHAAIAAFRRDSSEALAILGLCLFIAAWLQVIFGLRPLENLRRRLLPVRAGQETQLEGRFPREVMPLVADLNGLLAAQQQAIVKARARAGELAHGLKTPLTALNSITRDLAARGDRGTAQEIAALVGRMQTHIGRELSRAQIATRSETPPRTPLLRAVQQLVETLKRAPRGNEIEWIVDIDPGAAVAIEADDLAELCGNLLENGLKWAKSQVRISAVGTAPDALLVEDDGPGVPDDKLNLIRKRYARLDDSREGAGLGLAIVSDIAEAYGFTVDFNRSPLGGLSAQVVLASLAEGPKRAKD
jgi:signal transduction histidine kinase